MLAGLIGVSHTASCHPSACFFLRATGFSAASRSGPGVLSTCACHADAQTAGATALGDRPRPDYPQLINAAVPADRSRRMRFARFSVYRQVLLGVGQTRRPGAAVHTRGFGSSESSVWCGRFRRRSADDRVGLKALLPKGSRPSTGRDDTPLRAARRLRDRQPVINLTATNIQARGRPPSSVMQLHDTPAVRPRPHCAPSRTDSRSVRERRQLR